MNTYNLSRNFWNWAFDNPEKIKPNHAALYFFAIEHCNRLGWKEKFGLPTTMAKEAIGIRSYNTYINTLNDLVDFGFIEFIEKSKNQYSSNIIALSNFDKADVKALDKALIKHDIKQGKSTSESISTVSKQETNNNELVTKNKVYDKSVHDCFDACLLQFPEHLYPKKPDTWLDTIDKLNRIDKIPFENIIEIVKKTRGDDFWSQNFLSLTKLRKQNKDGVKYIIVFNEKIKSNGKQTNGNTVGNTGVSAEYLQKLRDDLLSD